MTSDILYHKIIEKVLNDFTFGLDLLLKNNPSSHGQIQSILSIFACLEYAQSKIIFSNISELFSLISVIALFKSCIPVDLQEIAHPIFKEWEIKIWKDFPSQVYNAFFSFIKSSLSVSPLEKAGR